MGLVAGVVSYVVLKVSEVRLRAGWTLAPALVVARELEPGQRLSSDMLAHRDVPEEFVTSTAARPNLAAYVIDQMLIVPVRAGDVVRWSFFPATRGPEPRMESPFDYKIWEACETALAASPTHKRERTSEELRARVASRRGEAGR